MYGIATLSVRPSVRLSVTLVLDTFFNTLAVVRALYLSGIYGKSPMFDSTPCFKKLIPFIFTARRSYASATLGVVILSVCLSVCPSVRPSIRPSVRLSHACFVTNPKNLPATFFTPHEHLASYYSWGTTSDAPLWRSAELEIFRLV